MGLRGELFSTKIILPNRTYFFNVKENRMGDLYLNIVESKNRETGGFDRQSVILFADDLQEFLKGFDESLKVMEKAVRDKRHSAPRGEKPYRREKPDHDEKEKGDFPLERKERRERQPYTGEGPSKKFRTKRGYDHKPEGGKRGGGRNESGRRDNGRNEGGRYNGGRNESEKHGGGRRVVVKKRDK